MRYSSSSLISAACNDRFANRFLSTLYSIFSKEFNAPLYKIQHHWAHAASLLIDNQIDEGIVLTLDGLGYGDDGNFWGSEILYTNINKFERLGHLEYMPLLGGDKATKDPRRLVYAIFKNFGEEKYFNNQEADVLNKLINKSPKSSSFGRFLDAISCYLDICIKIGFFLKGIINVRIQK